MFNDLKTNKPKAAPTLDQLKATLNAAGAALDATAKTAAPVPAAAAPAPAPAIKKATSPAISKPAAAMAPKPVVPPAPVPVQAPIDAAAEQDPVIVEDVPEAEQEEEGPRGVVDTEQNRNFLAAITGTGVDSTAALMAAHEAAGTSQGGLLFPVLTQAPGPAGGAFQRVSSKNKAHVAADLPEGKNAFGPVVFMDYRYGGAIWPDGGSSGGGPAQKPVESFSIPTSNPDAVGKLMAAGKAFQFSRNREKHTIAKGGPGVVKPHLEVLLFDPQTNDVFVYRCPGHYSSAQGFKDQLLANAVRDANGGLVMQPFVAEFTPHTERKVRDGAQAIVWHYPLVKKIDVSDAHAQAAVAAYREFIKNADNELVTTGGQWHAGSDAPLNQAALDAFDNAIAIG
jgi:hypothetical protein